MIRTCGLKKKLLWTFEELKGFEGLSNNVANPHHLLSQIFGEQVTEKLSSRYDNFNTDQSLFLQDSIQRSNFEQARQLVHTKRKLN